MQTKEILLEGGVAIQPGGSGWRPAHVADGPGLAFADVAAICRELGVRPVVIVQDYGATHLVELLLCHDPKQLYQLRITDVEQRALHTSLDYLKVRDVVYMLQSVAYHSVELCKAYRDACASFVTLPTDLIGAGEPIVTYQGPVEAYFEFDALVTAVRRAYDSLRYLLWRYFGPGRGSVPSSFSRTLNRCVSLPDELAKRLVVSWETCGEPVTAYRDCIQHYCPVGLGLATMWMTRSPSGVWTTSARIPDNPSARTQVGFTYAGGLDALKFGWDSANEILDIAALIVDGAIMVSDAAHTDA